MKSMSCERCEREFPEIYIDRYVLTSGIFAVLCNDCANEHTLQDSANFASQLAALDARKFHIQARVSMETDVPFHELLSLANDHADIMRARQHFSAGFVKPMNEEGSDGVRS